MEEQKALPELRFHPRWFRLVSEPLVLSSLACYLLERGVEAQMSDLKAQCGQEACGRQRVERLAFWRQVSLQPLPLAVAVLRLACPVACEIISMFLRMQHAWMLTLVPHLALLSILQASVSFPLLPRFSLLPL